MREKKESTHAGQGTHVKGNTKGHRRQAIVTCVLSLGVSVVAQQSDSSAGSVPHGFGGKLVLAFRLV